MAQPIKLLMWFGIWGLASAVLRIVFEYLNLFSTYSPAIMAVWLLTLPATISTWIIESLNVARMTGGILAAIFNLLLSINIGVSFGIFYYLMASFNRVAGGKRAGREAGELSAVSIAKTVNNNFE